MELSARPATLAARRDVRDRARGADRRRRSSRSSSGTSGVPGFGEAAPIARYGESADSALAWLESVELGDDPWALDEIASAASRRASRPRRAALDAALHDLQGKLTGLPVHRLLGLRRDGPPTSWTVWLGDPDEMARRAEEAPQRGLPAAQAEARRPRRARPRARARGRARRRSFRSRSTSTSTGRSTRRSSSCRRCRSSTASSRSPPATRAAPELKRRSPVPIYVDEDCHTLADVAACAERGARVDDQAREVGRDPRGGADGARGAGARARASCSAAWSSRGSGSLPLPTSRASSTTSTSTETCSSHATRGRGSSSSTACSVPRAGPGSVSRARRLLILAEGYSADPHYGKTARGVIRYRPEEVVAILDSQRAGEIYEGIPIVGTVADALALRADDRARRRRDAGRTLPAGLARASARLHRAPGSTSRADCTSSSRTTRSSSALAARHGVELARPPQASARPERPDRRQPHPSREGRAHCRVRLRDREDDRRARARRRVEAPRASRASSSRPVRRGSRSRAGGSPSTRSSPTSSPAPPSGSSSRASRAAGGCSSSRGRARCSIPPTPESLSVSSRRRPARARALPSGRTGVRRRGRALSDPALPELVELHERPPCSRARRRSSAIALNTRRSTTDDARRAIEDARAETGLPVDDPVRFGPAGLTSSVLAAFAFNPQP